MTVLAVGWWSVRREALVASPSHSAACGSEVSGLFGSRGGLRVVRAMTSIRFQVLGKPQPAGSKKGFVNPKTGKVIITEDAKKSKPWKQEVASTAEHAVSGDEGWTVCDPRPMRLEVAFILARPKGHFGTGRNAGTVRESAPRYPATKPDATKLLRAVEDALTGVVWRDDAQVVEQAAWKIYGEPERVEIKVTVLEIVEGEDAPEQMRLAA